MKLSSMWKKLIVLSAFAMASNALAQDTSSVFIRNICDSLSSVVEFVPAYIEETNWYGNPQTWTKDSSNFTRHESYRTVKASSNNFKDSIPLSIQANCLESQLTTYRFATWNNSKEWVELENDDFATVVYDIHNLKMEGHDSSNTNNILAYIPGAIPDKLSFPASHLLFSKPYEFAFEWWFASISFTHLYRNATDDSLTLRMRTKYGTSVGNDSLKTVNNAIGALNVPDTVKSARIQVLKVVLIDSRKPLQPESSSSVVVSSSSESSSSSGVPASSSSEKSSSSVTPESSSSVKSGSSSKIESSSSEPESSSAESSSSAKSSSSQPKSSSSVKSSSSKVPESSSSDKVSSSSEKKSSSSSKPASSSSEGKSSSSKNNKSSSSEKSDRIVALESQDVSRYVVQVRRLDGTVVKNAQKVGPGVYYVKYSDGIWQKKAVLQK